MPDRNPHVIILGGPNGAGKSTAAPHLLKGALAVDEFVNADTLAAGLSAFEPDRAAMQAGRVMLARLHELARRRVDFAFEVTLSGRGFARWIAGLIEGGYRFHLVFLWLATPELATARVAERVRLGGHRVPEDVVRRRYRAGLVNFFHLYQPLASTWRLYDNSMPPGPRLVASGSASGGETIADPATWAQILAEVANG